MHTCTHTGGEVCQTSSSCPVARSQLLGSYPISISCWWTGIIQREKNLKPIPVSLTCLFELNITFFLFKKFLEGIHCFCFSPDTTEAWFLQLKTKKTGIDYTNGFFLQSILIIRWNIIFIILLPNGRNQRFTLIKRQQLLIKR